MAKQLLFNQGSGGGLSGGTVLWENQNPTQAVGAQFADLPDLSQYNFISVKWLSFVGDNFVMETVWKYDEFEAAMQLPYGGVPFGVVVYPYTYMRAIGLDPTTNRYYLSDAYVNTGTMRNDTVIPQQVIGY